MVHIIGSHHMKKKKRLNFGSLGTDVVISFWISLHRNSYERGYDRWLFQKSWAVVAITWAGLFSIVT